MGRSPEQREEDADDILSWLRQGQPDSLDPTGEFKKINQLLPPKDGQRPEDRANEIESALDWSRNSSPKDVEDNETPPFEQLASVPVTRRSPVEREKDTDDILTWIRQGKDVADDTTGDFEVIDNLLPKKPLQRPEE